MNLQFSALGDVEGLGMAGRIHVVVAQVVSLCDAVGEYCQDCLVGHSG